ncbi:MAG TPA: hypothetical protein VGR63_08825 [Casimicrobiaceae bacterium]|nr:hypothetical protein [Casimicrobiaceae bacterium]
MIDRSQFLEELKRNPDLVHRIAVIVAGEVGGGNIPIEKQLIQAETIFNRAMSRGQTLEQATKQTYHRGDDGYYPASTISNGERIMSRPGAEARFKELVFKPVANGSDVGTEKLGFAPTGNASDSGKNRYGEPFATGNAARGLYAKSKWYGDPAKGGEMYVEEKSRLDRPERIAAARKGGPQPTVDVAGKPPSPDTAAAPQSPATAPQSTGSVAAGMVTGDRPFEPTNEEQQTLVAGEPTVATPVTPAAPAPAVAKTPATTTTVSARAATPRPTLGAQIIKAMGPRGLDRSSYIDPGTGREILNPPARSGEEAMGITRDLGRPPSQQPSRAAARPPPTRREAGPPASTTGQGVDQTPSAARAEEPVPLPRVRPSLAPFDPSAMDPTLLTQQRPIDMGPRLDEGPTPPGAISAARPPQADFLSTLFKDYSRTPDRPMNSPFTADEAQRRPMSPFDTGSRPAPFPFAPEAARMLVSPQPDQGVTLPRSLENQSASPSFGGTRPLSIAPGRTVDQQLLGLSPFTVPGGGSEPQPPAQAAPVSPVASGPNLSPFEQWPPPWWNFAGGDFGGGGGGFGGGYDFGAFG